MYETIKAQYPNLPVLTGTPKQVARATSLRLKAISDAQQDLIKLTRKADWIEGMSRRMRELGEDAFTAELTTKIKASPEVAAAHAAQIASVVARLNHALTQTDAKWFITNRDRGGGREP